MTDWVLSIRGGLRQRVAVAWATGMRSPPIERFEATARLNDLGTWTMELPAETHAARHLVPRAGVVLTRDGVVVFSGPIRAIEERHTATGTLLAVTGIDDTGQLSERDVWPDPAGPPFATSHDVRTGPAETRLHQYVSFHAANNALARRNIEGLSIGTDSGRGAVGTTRARFDNLLELLQKIAAPDGLVFTVLQIEGEFQFQTRLARDLRSSVVFSLDRGNLASAVMTDEAPVANRMIAGGDDAGTRRAFAELGDPDSIARWGLIEGFYDIRSSTSPDELNAALREELAASAEVIGLELEPIETTTTQAYRDYDLGDRVTIVLPDGDVISGYVSEMRLAVDGDGVTVTPIVTTVPLAARPRSGLSHTTSRVAFLEANAENSRISTGVAYLWLGTVEAIPAGHELCDGDNGTTDLRGYFLVGAGGTYSQFQTGGADSVNLQHNHSGAAHTHPGSHSHGMAHTHSHDHGNATSVPSATSNRADGANPVGSETHHHTIASDGTASSASSTQPDTNAPAASFSGSTGNALGTHDNRPNFKAVLVIMRMTAY